MKKKILAFILAILMAASLLPTAAFALEPAYLDSPADSVTFQDVDTLMIYNPYLGEYDYGTHTTNLSTGNMSGQISKLGGNVGGHSKVISEERELFYFGDQRAFLQELEGIRSHRGNATTANKELNKITTYQVDDTRDFYYEEDTKASFTCLYAGTYCYVWGGAGYTKHTTKAIAQLMGQEFDEKVYANDVNSFGSARFIKDGGKLNILVYDMNSTGLCGYFNPYELMTRDDLGYYYDEFAKSYTLSEATIHVNSYMCSSRYYESVGMVTLAHEFQHLICFSSTLLGDGAYEWIEMGTWLNEAMSMQAEEISYPGEVAKQEYISDCYNFSGDIAGGQSLYDFATDNDIGVYGQVFMFSEYLKAQYGGKGVFKDIHDYWRLKDENYLTDADVLSTVLPASYYNTLDADIVYPGDLENSIGSEEENTLSKLNLAFQISTVLQDESGIYSIGNACDDAAPKLYTSNSCSIPGGGRIYVKTANGSSYTVPSDADADLIYVGFKDGEMTVEPTRAADYAYEVEDGLSLGTVTVTGNGKNKTYTQNFTITSVQDRNAVLLVVCLDSNGRQVNYQYVELPLKKGNNTAKVEYSGNINGTNLLAFLVSGGTWVPIVGKTEWTFTA